MWYVATVHKDVLASTMAVKVSEDQELTLFYKVVNHLLGVVNRWVEHFRWRLPSAIQITSCERAAIIAIDDTVRVQHGNNFENKVLSKDLRLGDICAR